MTYQDSPSHPSTPLYFPFANNLILRRYISLLCTSILQNNALTNPSGFTSSIRNIRLFCANARLSFSGSPPPLPSSSRSSSSHMTTTLPSSQKSGFGISHTRFLLNSSPFPPPSTLLLANGNCGSLGGFTSTMSGAKPSSLP